MVRQLDEGEKVLRGDAWCESAEEGEEQRLNCRCLAMKFMGKKDHREAISGLERSELRGKLALDAEYLQIAEMQS